MHVEAAAVGADVVEGVGERPGGGRADDEDEHDEHEHRERDAGAEEAPQRVGDRHAHDRRDPLTRPSVAPSVPSRMSALYMIVQVAPITIISPPRTKIEKLTLIRPNSRRRSGT